MSSKSSKKSKQELGCVGPDTATFSELVRLGRIVGPHGLAGALRFRPDNAELDTLTALRHLFLRRAGETTPYEVESIGPLSRGNFKLELAAIDDADAAEELRGAEVYGAKADLPEVAAGEFYYFQAEGCEVRLSDGSVLGRIESTFFTGANDVWIVKSDSREFLIPVIEDVVRSINLEARQVTIEPIPGLLD